MRGHIDILTSAGVVEGWAFDPARPLNPLLVALKDADEVDVACGYANLFRKDLAENGVGLGWCAFRLHVTVPVSRLRGTSASLFDVETGAPFAATAKLGYVETGGPPLTTLAEVTACDPTILGDLSQIESFEPVFNEFIKARGVDAFVRTAYVYVLNRAIDSDGLKLYGRLLRRHNLTPFGLLQTLAVSEEFRSRPRQLVAPTERGFPFRLSE